MKTRTARQTGTTITVGSADDLGLDPSNGDCRYYTICDEHGTCVGFSSRRRADSFASVPKEWCEFCADPTTWCATCANDHLYCDCEEPK